MFITTKLWYSLAIIVPISTWSVFFYFLLNSKRKTSQLFNERHECVVMYSPSRGVTGWPGEEGQVFDHRSRANFVPNVDFHFQPICFFISTAKNSIDIAVMALNINAIGDALICAKRRGVKVRIIVDFLTAKGDSLIKKLKSTGIEVNYYIPPIEGRESIMHYKYMVKDYVEGNSGFAAAGSMNMTMTGLFNNYENIVFSKNLDLVKSLHDNFEITWDFIEVSKSSYNVKAKYNLLF